MAPGENRPDHHNIYLPKGPSGLTAPYPPAMGSSDPPRLEPSGNVSGASDTFRAPYLPKMRSSGNIAGAFDSLVRDIPLTLERNIDAVVARCLEKKFEKIEDVIEKKLEDIRNVIVQKVKQQLDSLSTKRVNSNDVHWKDRQSFGFPRERRDLSPERVHDVRVDSTDAQATTKRRIPSVDDDSDPESLFCKNRESSSLPQKRLPSTSDLSDLDSLFGETETPSPFSKKRGRMNEEAGEDFPSPKRAAMTQTSPTTVTSRSSPRTRRQTQALIQNVHPFRKESLQGRRLSDSERRASQDDDNRRRSSASQQMPMSPSNARRGKWYVPRGGASVSPRGGASNRGHRRPWSEWRDRKRGRS